MTTTKSMNSFTKKYWLRTFLSRYVMKPSLPVTYWKNRCTREFSIKARSRPSKIQDSFVAKMPDSGKTNTTKSFKKVKRIRLLVQRRGEEGFLRVL